VEPRFHGAMSLVHEVLPHFGVVGVAVLPHWVKALHVLVSND
jgi:hypothetical protein